MRPGAARRAAHWARQLGSDGALAVAARLAGPAVPPGGRRGGRRAGHVAGGVRQRHAEGKAAAAAPLPRAPACARCGKAAWGRQAGCDQRRLLPLSRCSAKPGATSTCRMQGMLKTPRCWRNSGAFWVRLPHVVPLPANATHPSSSLNHCPPLAAACGAAPCERHASRFVAEPLPASVAVSLRRQVNSAAGMAKFLEEVLRQARQAQRRQQARQVQQAQQAQQRGQACAACRLLPAPGR